ncbi:hypothetical protein FOCC_FOCC004643, partial [Frankliniella occidentalis]
MVVAQPCTPLGSHAERPGAHGCSPALCSLRHKWKSGLNLFSLKNKVPQLWPRRSLVGGSKAAEANLDLRMLAGDALPLTRDYRTDLESQPLPPGHPPPLPLHREMAVDVPDSFIARSKTPPRYPPPRPVGTTGTGVNGSVVKPVPPPRAHLRIEEDGRLVNRAPAPQLPARPPDNNNEPDKEPTQEQLTAIRKYQVSKARRCAEEDRVWGMGTSAEPRSSGGERETPSPF